MRLMEQHQVNLEYYRSKHLTDMGDLQKEEDIIVEKEIPALESEINQLNNDIKLTEQRLNNIRDEQEFYSSTAKEYAKMIQDINNLVAAMSWKGEVEKDEMESLQVRLYNQTIIQATMADELEQLTAFLEELIKRHKGDK